MILANAVGTRKKTLEYYASWRTFVVQTVYSPKQYPPAKSRSYAKSVASVKLGTWNLNRTTVHPCGLPQNGVAPPFFRPVFSPICNLPIRGVPAAQRSGPEGRQEIALAVRPGIAWTMLRAGGPEDRHSALGAAICVGP